jgi:Na+-driven multidrug efflux pump
MTGCGPSVRSELRGLNSIRKWFSFSARGKWHGQGFGTPSGNYFPIAISELLWGISTFVYTILLTRLGIAALTSSQIVMTITKSILLCHAVGSYGIGVPAAILSGFILRLSVWGVFGSRALEEVLKTVFFLMRYRTPAWYKKTVDGPSRAAANR